MDCWHHKLDQANTETEVATQAADYLALWAPSELEPLTLGWREVRVETGEDVARVKKWFLDSPGVADPTTHLHDLAGYFWHAAARIETIRRAPH
ncbi:MAG TPA: hypothetical protein VM073_07205 [Usitatibacter sp.]|nr:hypothetical protein [Usitatibacter sp.]